MSATIPTAKQAQAFWLAATGMNARQISEVIGGSPQGVQTLLTSARLKAKRAGLQFKCTPPTPQTIIGSGMLHAMDAADGAGLLPIQPMKGFEALKQLAKEAMEEGAF